MNKVKPFSKRLYDENDKIAKLKMIEVLDRWGYEGKVNPDRYGIDVLASKIRSCPPYDFGDNIAIDVEIKHPWKGKDFIFEDLHIPYRKKKYVADNAYFAVFNYDLNCMAFIHSNSLLRCSVEEVSNCFVRSGEGFYIVPIDEVIFYEI